jgi:hypothetical protein
MGDAAATLAQPAVTAASQDVLRISHPTFRGFARVTPLIYVQLDPH